MPSCFVGRTDLLFAPFLRPRYDLRRYYGRIRPLSSLRLHLPLHWPMLPTASRAEPLRSPRYAEYNNVMYATPFDPEAASQSSFKLVGAVEE